MYSVANSIARMAVKQSLRLVKERNILSRTKTKLNKPNAGRWESHHERSIIELANILIHMNKNIDTLI